MEKVKVCECCGAKMVEYKHILNKGLVGALYELAHFNEPMPLTDLNITRNQWTNFQKLRYWGLADKKRNADGSATGYWFVTTLGREFVFNNLPVPRIAWSFRGETVRLDGKEIQFKDIYELEYRQRRDYARDSEIHLGI